LIEQAPSDGPKRNGTRCLSETTPAQQAGIARISDAQVFSQPASSSPKSRN
jgi:hypothetical protein